MLEKISGVIQAITDFLGGFSKLNEVRDHSVVIFFKIILCTLVALFLGKLFLRNDLYDWIVDTILNLNPITLGVTIGVAMWVYAMYSQKRIMNAVLEAMHEQKKKDKECYAQTSRIETEANDMTDYLRDALHCDVVTVELMHNTEKYIGGYHKRFYDESFPSINTAEGVQFNCKDYQCIPTNLFPIIGYMLKNKFEWFPDMKEVAKVDAGYAKVLKDHKCIALGMRAMKTSKGEDLGILTVSWREEHVIQERMTEIAAKFEILLDMSDYD